MDISLSRIGPVVLLICDTARRADLRDTRRTCARPGSPATTLLRICFMVNAKHGAPDIPTVLFLRRFCRSLWRFCDIKENAFRAASDSSKLMGSMLEAQRLQHHRQRSLRQRELSRSSVVQTGRLSVKVTEFPDLPWTATADYDDLSQA